jgi:serine/threonine protein phosphatase 1
MYSNLKFLKTIPANYEGRDFLIGDLHGCYDELMKLLNYVKFDPQFDRLFATGDLIDRGPKSVECLDLLSKPWFFSVLGNHEDLLIEKINDIKNEKISYLSYEEINYINSLSPYINYIYNMPLILEIEHLLFGSIYIIHAEILPEHLIKFNDLESIDYNVYFNMMQKNDFSEHLKKFFNKYKNKDITYDLKQKLLWSRKQIFNYYKNHKQNILNKDYSFLEEKIPSKLKIFCGHNIVPFPMKIGQQFYIDTGAALGYSSKELSSYLFETLGYNFYTLSMVDLSTGLCYGCITSENNRGKILKFKKSLYD